MSKPNKFRIEYVVRNPANRKTGTSVFIETLADAVASYCPDADLYIEVGLSQIEMDVCEDMYSFHDDLLELAEAIAFDRESRVGYDNLLPVTSPEQRTYGIIVTTDPLHLMAFLVEDNRVFMRPESHDRPVVEPLESDATLSSCRKRDVVLECCSFLEMYLSDLIRQLPSVRQLEDYKRFRQRLEEIKNQAFTWEEG